MRCKHKEVKQLPVFKGSKVTHGYCTHCGSHNVEGTWITASEMASAINPPEKVKKGKKHE
jgi:hypothetical protein